MAPGHGNRTVTYHICREKHGEMDREKESRKGKKKGKKEKKETKSSAATALLAPASDAYFVYIERVCFSVSVCVDCVIFPHCEWIDAVHANPVGGGQPAAVN